MLESLDCFLPRACDLSDGIVGGGFCCVQGDRDSMCAGLFEFLGAFEVAGGSRSKDCDDEAVLAGMADNLVDIGA